MTGHDDSWVVIFETAEPRRASEASLVLTARDIGHRLETGPGRWALVVAERRAAEARAELELYADENRRAATAVREIRPVGRGWPGVAAYVGLLLTTAIAIRRWLFGLDWLEIGALDAERVRAGEWWRTVTALTAHRELDHLLGNISFGSFFGYFVARYLGAGMGWAAILASGVLGNLLNAWIQPAGHRAIGASTAVFGALGLLTAYHWQRGFLRSAAWRVRAAPIIAGIGLLAYTGTGGTNTDVLAHLTGFVAGFGCGALLARYEAPRGQRAQQLYAGMAAGVIVAAWLLAAR